MPGSRRRACHARRALVEAGSALLGVVLLLWSLTPVYNMFLIALDPEEGEVEFDGNIWPPSPSLDAFGDALSQEARYLEEFWRQFGNSIYIGFAVTTLTVIIGSLASFAVCRLRRRWGTLLGNAGLIAYAIPTSCLVIPLYRIMGDIGLADNRWAVIAAQVAFTTPFAMVILQQYSRLVPIELDEAARIDGASAGQIYRRIYLPLMLPALVIVAAYALVIAWNDYVFQFVLLTSQRNTTVSIMQAQLFADTDAPWNAMMAAAIIYAMPPLAVLFAMRGYVTRRLRGVVVAE